jgi:hypothetical protein
LAFGGRRDEAAFPPYLADGGFIDG